MWRQQLLAQMLSAALARVHFCVRRTQHLFSWAIERLQFVERALGGVPNAPAPVSRLAMSDTDDFPGRPCVDGGSVTSGGFSDDLWICRNIWPLWMAGSNGSTLPSASSRSFAIDVLDGCMVKGGGVQGHFRTFRWLNTFWFRRL